MFAEFFTQHFPHASISLVKLHSWSDIKIEVFLSVILLDFFNNMQEFNNINKVGGLEQDAWDMWVANLFHIYPLVVTHCNPT